MTATPGSPVVADRLRLVSGEAGWCAWLGAGSLSGRRVCDLSEYDGFVGIAWIKDNDTGRGGTVKNRTVQTGNAIRVCDFEIMFRLVREQDSLPCQEQGQQKSTCKRFFEDFHAITIGVYQPVLYSDDIVAAHGLQQIL